jgi:hypothetical protein
VRAGTVACALEGWGESGVRVRVRADVAGRYLPPPLDSALEMDPVQKMGQKCPKTMLVSVQIATA